MKLFPLRNMLRVAAVASKSLERAAAFAEKNGVLKAYGDYEEMLRMEKPDGAYIAVTPNDHYRLSMLCLKYGVPVLAKRRCSKTAGRQKKFLRFQKKRHLCDGSSLEPLPSRLYVKSANGWTKGGSARRSLPAVPLDSGRIRIPKEDIIHRNSEAGHRKILLSMPMRSQRICSARS